MTTAQTIFQQLGGNQLAAMTGAKFIDDGNTLIVKFPGSKRANIAYFTLNSMDTYDVKFCKYRANNVKVVSQHENMYNDQIRGLFEQETGLRTSLTRVYNC